jgi:hypothetical protein
VKHRLTLLAADHMRGNAMRSRSARALSLQQGDIKE